MGGKRMTDAEAVAGTLGSYLPAQDARVAARDVLRRLQGRYWKSPRAWRGMMERAAAKELVVRTCRALTAAAEADPPVDADTHDAWATNAYVLDAAVPSLMNTLLPNQVRLSAEPGGDDDCVREQLVCQTWWGQS